MTGLPEFLIIGAQKAGTSWLHRNLQKHPGIFLPETKDQAYFCWCEGPEAISLEQYRKEFSACAPGQLIGEATAAYFWTESGTQWGAKPEVYCDDVPRRVLDTLGGDTRLVLSLRDPVQRAISAYLHHIAFGDLDPRTSLLEAGDFIGLLDIGFYAAHLRNWLRYFPLQQLLVLDFEQDIVQSPDATLQRAFDFLGVEPNQVINAAQQAVFAGSERLWLEDEVWVPLEQYPQAPPNQQKKINGRSWCRRVDASTIENLQSIYTDDQQRLRELLG